MTTAEARSKTARDASAPRRTRTPATLPGEAERARRSVQAEVAGVMATARERRPCPARSSGGMLDVSLKTLRRVVPPAASQSGCGAVGEALTRVVKRPFRPA